MLYLDVKLFSKLEHIIPGAARARPLGCGHSKIARVRAYYLYCMWLPVLIVCRFDRNDVLSDCHEVPSDPLYLTIVIIMVINTLFVCFR